MAEILLVGPLAPLLRERERVLRRAGHNVVTATFGNNQFRSAMQREFDVVIIGHAVPERKRNRIAQSLKLRSPQTAVVLFYRGSIQRTELADAILNADGNHKDLLFTVEHLLSRRRETRAARAG
jgi:DNA-binding NtrC family response regulator